MDELDDERPRMQILPIPLNQEELEAIDAYWRAANYCSVGQIYLMDNPLLTEPLLPKHVKPRLLGHFGTTPGLNLIYAHLNRVIKARDLNMMYVIGPGHGGPGIVANAYLEGTYTEVYPHIGQDAEGLRKLFRQFSFPGGIPSHVAPQTPGSIHEGGELGYSLVHAYGAVLDNPDLIVACVIGDGEAETGPLAASWHSNKFLDPVGDGAVLPILHLNGYKIANPTVLARLGDDELTSLLVGYGHRPIFVRGDEPADVHQQLAAALDDALGDIARIQAAARSGRAVVPTRVADDRPVHAKGMDLPKGGRRSPGRGDIPRPSGARGRCPGQPRAPQDPRGMVAELSARGTVRRVGWASSALQALAPTGTRRMSANPHANGGLLLQDLDLPDFRRYAVTVETPGVASVEPTRVLGNFLRDVIKANPSTFRIVGPDETISNRLSAVFEATDRVWEAETVPGDEFLASQGRVMEVLSEHLCEGWLEGYLLTGRHGLFNCYEAFIHIVDSMLNQHAKWLKTSKEIPWRRPIASLNYLLSSHVWRQDHNGFSHQDPGFIDHLVNKKPAIVRVYLPPDANTLLSVADHCLRSRDYVNLIVAGKQPALTYLTMDEAVDHCTRGLGIFEWASNDGGDLPDVVLGCAGDIPTLETVAAAAHSSRDDSRTQGPRRQRRRLDADVPRIGASARVARGRVRRFVHEGQASDLRLSRLSVVDPPPGVSPHQSSQLPCAGLQGRGNHHHALRHGDDERHGPLPSGHGCDRPRTGSLGESRPRPPEDARRQARCKGVHPRARRG